MDITSGAVYAPLFKFHDNLSKVQAIFCVDQQKMNMLSLFGDYTIDELDTLPLAADIHEYMDKQTREHLRKLPLDFMRYWQTIDNDSSAMTQSVGPGHLSVMRVRAEKLQRSIMVTYRHDNVVTVNFRKSA
jgi:hypothetical protein